MVSFAQKVAQEKSCRDLGDYAVLSRNRIWLYSNARGEFKRARALEGLLVRPGEAPAGAGRALSSIAIPIVAIVSGVLLLREPLSPLQMVAITLSSVVALWLALMPGRGSA